MRPQPGQTDRRRQLVGTLREDCQVSERDVPSRHQWLPSALPVLFGEEPASSDPWPGLVNVVTKFAALAVEVGEEAVRGAAAVASAAVAHGFTEIGHGEGPVDVFGLKGAA